jgi:hypothetical protein
MVVLDSMCEHSLYPRALPEWSERLSLTQSVPAVSAAHLSGSLASTAAAVPVISGCQLTLPSHLGLTHYSFLSSICATLTADGLRSADHQKSHRG